MSSSRNQPTAPEQRYARSGPTDEQQGRVPYTAAARGQLDLNHATERQLCALDGIDEALAQRIIEERVHHGHFQDWEDVRRVAGVGEQELSVLKRVARLAGPLRPTQD